MFEVRYHNTFRCCFVCLELWMSVWKILYFGLKQSSSISVSLLHLLFSRNQCKGVAFVEYFQVSSSFIKFCCFIHWGTKQQVAYCNLQPTICLYICICSSLGNRIYYSGCMRDFPGAILQCGTQHRICSNIITR